MSKPKKRVVACYARVSTSKKEQASSYENQQSFFKDYCERNNLKIHKIYADKGISGTLFQREKFEQMLYDAGLDLTINRHEAVITKEINCMSDEAVGKPSVVQYINYTVLLSDREPKFNVILVRNTSRFARNIEVDVILKRLRLKGVYVHFLDIDKSTEREEDITVIQLFQTFDELFVRDLSRKVLAGNERSVANKIVRSHPKLYGYKYIQRSSLQENNKLIPVPEEAEVVQKIFRLYAGCFNPDEPFIGCDFDCNSCTIKKTSGIGIRRIINYLTACGIKTRNGKNFGSTTIKNILSNEKYAGYVNTGKYTTGTIFNKFTYSKVKDDYMLELDPENIEPIISPELFYQCVAIRNSRVTKDSKGKPPARSAYGGGFLICGKCGSAYQHNVDRGKPFYQCGLKKSKGLKACNSANVSEATVEFYLTRYEQGELSFMVLRYRQSAIIRTLDSINYRLTFIRRNRDDDKLQALQEQHTTLTKRLKNLYTRHADEDGDTTVLDGLIASTKAELDEITAELDKYTKKPQQYLIEAENLITYTQELLSEHEVHMKNLRRTYTREEVLATIPYLTVYGETLPKGGKAPNVEIIPSVMTDLELEEFLSADAKEFRTYKPLKIKAEQSTFIVGNEADNFSVVPLTKRESAALKDDPNIMQLFPVASLRDTLMDLSEMLKALQSLYF
jgi:site-specific DNA recombinase